MIYVNAGLLVISLVTMVAAGLQAVIERCNRSANSANNGRSEIGRYHFV
ncbi:MAG: hypothetical protein ACI92G_004759 [Candidatus Pelagisphaera sp.]|jgi:hypothetical protein